MKGTILDFLKLAAEKPEVAKELAELAAKHGIEFSDEVRDEELESVAGGLETMETVPGSLDMESLEGQVLTQAEDTQMTQFGTQQKQEQFSRDYTMLANILKSYQEASQSIVNNLRG